MVRSLVGNRRTELVAKQKMSLAGTLAFAGLFGCVGLGYVLGNAFPWRTQPQAEHLSASGPSGATQRGIAPGPIEDKDAMAQRAQTYFLTAVYNQQTDAMLAMRSLRKAGLPMAGLQLVASIDKATGKEVSYFGLVVWFDGERDGEQTKAALQKVPAPDSEFERFRKTTKDWPSVRSAR